MVLVVAKWWYPTHKQNEVVEIFQKVPPEDLAKMAGEVVLVGAVKPGKDGVEGFTIRKADANTLSQTMTDLTNLFVTNYASVEGYEFSIEVWGDMSETAG